MESKGVGISLTRREKINKALYQNRNWLFHDTEIVSFGEALGGNEFDIV